jgi:hypothetical protein
VADAGKRRGNARRGAGAEPTMPGEAASRPIEMPGEAAATETVATGTESATAQATMAATKATASESVAAATETTAAEAAMAATKATANESVAAATETTAVATATAATTTAGLSVGDEQTACERDGRQDRDRPAHDLIPCSRGHNPGRPHLM